MKTQISEWAKALGFDAVGFAPARLTADAQAGLDGFLERAYHGDMEWMATHAARRRDPQSLWESAKTVLVVGHNYAPDYNPLQKLEEAESGLISCYAQGKDYHDIIKKRLKILAERIERELGIDAKIFVDTAPLMEKPLAEAAGIGWQGKHTCLVSRQYGSWLFLGEILLDREMPQDTPETDHCGGCTRCLDICPTQAFDGPRRLDARKCISYLTIEHKGPIPLEFRRAIGNRIYGCDDCLAVCPWNKFAKRSQEIAYHATAADLPLLSLREVLTWDDGQFRARFSGSPIKRIKRERFLRNALIAAGNSGDKALLPAIVALMNDPSPLVRGMAVWAFGELAKDDEILALADVMMPNEQDHHVLAEWRHIHGKS